MADINTYMISYDACRRIFSHMGFYGKGRDLMLDLPCTISVVRDSFQPDKKYFQQVFAGLTPEQTNLKLEQLSKASYNFFVPHTSRILATSVRKNDDKTNDLIIVYNMDPSFMTLQDLINERKADEEPFSEEEVLELINALLDNLYMGARLSFEFTDINPLNIFINDDKNNYDYNNDEGFRSLAENNMADTFFSRKEMDRTQQAKDKGDKHQADNNEEEVEENKKPRNTSVGKNASSKNDKTKNTSRLTNPSKATRYTSSYANFNNRNTLGLNPNRKKVRDPNLEGNGGCYYIISNLGLQPPRSLIKTYHNPFDKFYDVARLTTPGVTADKASETFVKSQLFVIGMMALHVATFEDPNELYSELPTNPDIKVLNTNKLADRLDAGLGARGFSEMLNNLIYSLLTIKEEKRITIEEIVRDREKGTVVIPRDFVYYQGKLENGSMYMGYVKAEFINNNNGNIKNLNLASSKIIPNRMGDLLSMNLEYYKGGVADGKRSGYGIWYNGKDTFLQGNWYQDRLREGILIKKGHYIYYGPLSEEMTPKGFGVMVTLTSDHDSKILFFKGEFSPEGERWRGLTVFKDGGSWEGELQHDKRQGPGVYYYPPRDGKIKYVGEFLEDKMHGNAMQYEDGTNEFNMFYENGELKEKIDLHPKVPDPKEQEDKFFKDSVNREKVLEAEIERKTDKVDESVVKEHEKPPSKKKK